MKYIILNGKTPTHKFKDGEGAKTWDEVKDYEDVAVIVPKGYVVLDFDTTSDATTMLKIIEGLELKCKVMQTTRGIHCWFRADEEAPKNYIKNRLAVGIYCDRKSGGRNAYVKIKQDGKLRKWLKKVDSKDIEVLPKWLTSVPAPSNQFAFKTMGEGSGRNQELFNYIVYLQTKGFTRDEIKTTIRIINEYVLAEPLDEYEVSTICRDEAFKDKKELTYSRGEKFHHNDFAKHLINKYHIVNVDGKSFSYVNNYYQCNVNLMEKLTIEELDSITIRERRETIDYIKIKAPKKRFSNPRYILFKNGVLDIKTREMLNTTTDYVIPNYIPWNYNPTAYNKSLDDVLNNVSCNDSEIRAIIEETLGYTFYRENIEQKAIIFTGTGKNGKSTILNLFEKVLGDENFSSEPLEKLSDRFSIVSLYKKLANISDDIDSTGEVNSSMFKKICVKGSISAEYKGKDKFKFVSYATPIFTANDLPKIGRGYDADAVNRRLIIVPFNADFTVENGNYDKHIEEKILTEEGIEYMIRLAVEGLIRLLVNGFTRSESAEEEKKDYVINTDVYSSFFDYLNNTYDDTLEDYVLKKYVGEIYSDFEEYCIEQRSSDYNKTVFGKRIKAYYELDKGYKQDSNTKKRKYRLKI